MCMSIFLSTLLYSTDIGSSQWVVLCGFEMSQKWATQSVCSWIPARRNLPLSGVFHLVGQRLGEVHVWVNLRRPTGLIVCWIFSLMNWGSVEDPGTMWYWESIKMFSCFVSFVDWIRPQNQGRLHRAPWPPGRPKLIYCTYFMKLCFLSVLKERRNYYNTPQLCGGYWILLDTNIMSSLLDCVSACIRVVSAMLQVNLTVRQLLSCVDEAKKQECHRNGLIPLGKESRKRRRKRARTQRYSMFQVLTIRFVVTNSQRLCSWLSLAC